ncbi:superoxide dismutase family protein [Shewanella sp. VB17]|uniref:superoxide dismutase family protein n=1 Tax=Shewanella sp. VB17 TaxID=2739432 RepID=UPI001C26339C
MNKLLLTTLLLASTGLSAENLSVNMKDLNSGEIVGRILIAQSDYGVVFTPQLSGLPAGLHGFHVHVNPSCETSEKNNQTILGGAAGGHYDPTKTGQHGYPWSNNNHLGDLPPLYVDMNGNAVQPVSSPRIKLTDLSGRALMIHAGGDNHADHPQALGGGGARLVCGVIQP